MDNKKVICIKKCVSDTYQIANVEKFNLSL